MEKLKAALSPVVGLPTGPINKFYDLDGNAISTLNKFVDRGYVIACGGEKPITGIYYKVQQAFDLNGSASESLHQHVKGKHYSGDTASSSHFSSAAGVGQRVNDERAVNHPDEFASSLRSSRRPIESLPWHTAEDDLSKDSRRPIQKFGVQANKAKVRRN